MEKNKKKQYINICLLLSLIAAIILAALVLSALGIGIPCVFHRITGLKCPGCGNTRALLSLIKFDFVSMLKYNPIFPLEVIYIAWVCFSMIINFIRSGKLLYKPLHIVIDISVLVLIVAWGIVRNFIGM